MKQDEFLLSRARLMERSGGDDRKMCMGSSGCSAPCLVSLTLHFLRATLCKRVNTQRLTTSWAISENVDQKYTIGEHVHADLLGHKRGCILPSRFPT